MQTFNHTFMYMCSSIVPEHGGGGLGHQQTFNHTFMYMCSSIVPEHGGGGLGHQPCKPLTIPSCICVVVMYQNMEEGG